MADYLHGIENIEVDAGGTSFSIARTGVIGLVGIAPEGPKNTPVAVYSERDFAQFGKQVPGFTIPQALAVIALQKAATVIVVNVFNEADHTTQITGETKTVTNGKLSLSAAPVGAVTVLDSEGAAVTYVEGTDYAIDAYGNFTVLSTEIANETVLKFTFKKLDLSSVEATDIIGEIDADSGARTGMKCWPLSKSLYGFNPKVLIAPVFSTLTAVVSELSVQADKMRAIYYVDAPAGTTVATAITGRGPAGSINFNITDKRGELVFPQLKKYDPASNANVNFPYSAFLAGIRQQVDNDEENGGYWVSSSNRVINCQGIEIPLETSISDPNADNQLLNAAGITTILNLYGLGTRSFGNRSSLFPGVTGPGSFTNIIRIDDVICEAMEAAALPYLDQGITQAFIDTIREIGNSLMRVFVQRGAVLVGSRVVYNRDDNDVSELQNGHIVFERHYMGSIPAERMTFKSVLDFSLLSNLK